MIVYEGTNNFVSGAFLKCFSIFVAMATGVSRNGLLVLSLTMHCESCSGDLNVWLDGYATLFNCTPVDRASDSMMAPT